MSIRSQNGVAILYGLLLLVIVAGVATLMFARTVAELRHSTDDAAIVQTLLIARGAGNLGGQVLQGAVRGRLEQLVDANPSSGRWAFGDGSTASTSPTPNSVVNDLTALASNLQTGVDAIVCGSNTFNLDSSASGTYRVYFTNNACGVSLPNDVSLPGGRFVEGLPRGGASPSAEQTYALPFVLIAEGSLGPYNRNVVLQGEYRFTVGRGSFAKYALFTNVHRTQSGGTPWFTETEMFDGPVHTNSNFRFSENPWFGGLTTTAGCNNPGQSNCASGANTRNGAEFYGYGYRSASQFSNPQAPVYGTNRPHFEEVDWNASFVPLPNNNQDQLAAARSGGLEFTSGLYSLTLSARDASGNVLSANSDGSYSTTATWQYIEACTSSSNCTVYRYGSDGVMQRRSGTSWTTVGPFNGVIYAAGTIQRFTGPRRVPVLSRDPNAAGPALASFAEITVTGTQDIRISGDIKYEIPPCTGAPTRHSDGETVIRPTCDNLDAKNVLGVFTPGGDILLGNNNGNYCGDSITSQNNNQYASDTRNVPYDVTVHGVLMASGNTGEVRVENYAACGGSGSNRGPRGGLNLIGGLIEYYYGLFGTWNSSGPATGFDRRFTYDQRMSLGVEPPYFPTVINDGVRRVSVFSFGQREQLY